MTNQTNEQKQAQLPDALLEKRVLGIPLKNLQNVGWGAALMTAFLFLESVLDVITGVKDGVDRMRTRSKVTATVPAEEIMRVEPEAVVVPQPKVAATPACKRHYLWLLFIIPIGYLIVANWEQIARGLLVFIAVAVLLFWYGLSYRSRQKAKAAIDFVMRRDGLQLPGDATKIIERARQVPGTATLTTDRAIPQIVMQRCLPEQRRRFSFRLPFRIVINLGALPRFGRRR